MDERPPSRDSDNPFLHRQAARYVRRAKMLLAVVGSLGCILAVLDLGWGVTLRSAVEVAIAVCCLYGLWFVHLVEEKLRYL